MEQYIQPKIHSDFINNTVDARVRVTKQLEVGNPAKTISFLPVWNDQKYKTVFAKAQYKKCAYCETKLTTTPDMEHFFPKALIKRLDSIGHEVPTLVNMRNQVGSVISCNGFWWLAYNWYNYLLSCSVCNERWKVNFLEMKINNDSRLLINNQSFVKRGKKYLPLLLHPFKGAVPYKHFKYTEYGFIQSNNNSVLGINSINIYGLHRPSLNDARQEKTTTTYYTISLYQMAVNNNNKTEIKKYITELTKLGHKSTSFSGMVKSIFYYKLGMSWELFIEINKDICEEVNVELDTIWETRIYMEYINYGSRLECTEQADKIKEMGDLSMPHYNIVRLVFKEISGIDWTTL